MTPQSPLTLARPKILAASLLVGAAALCLIVSAPRASRAQPGGRTATRSLVSAFSLLREPAVGQPARALVDALAHVPASFAIDVSASRRSVTTGAWLIPGNGGLCIAVPDSEGVGVSCVSAASAERGELSFQEVATRAQKTTVIGALPDWIPSVQIRTAAGAGESSAVVKESTYAATGLRTSVPVRVAEGSLEAAP